MNKQENLSLKLQRRSLEAENICVYEFVAADGGDLPNFVPGAHIQLHLPSGLSRSYSLANASSERHRYVIAVQRESEGRGASVWMHDQLEVGQVIQASSPVQNFGLNESGFESILIAGGIGITPILSMIERLDALDLPWRLFYAARSAATAAFRSRLTELDQGRGRVSFYFKDLGVERLNLKKVIQEAAVGTHFYCCGPARMIDAYIEAGQSQTPEHLHYERFSASQDSALEGGFTVRLQSNGQQIAVKRGESILDALLDAGVTVSYACSNGICGSCMTRVVSGLPDHRDEFLSEEEKRAGNSMLICCSGSKTPELVLDL
jgi:ferredoxin-NADP reductase